MNVRSKTSGSVRGDFGGEISGWGLLALLALSAGCTELPRDAGREMQQARAALDTRDFAACERFADDVIVRYPEHPGTAEAFYLRGQAKLLSARRRPAWDDFDYGRTLVKDRLLRALLQVQLGNMAFDDASFDQAEYFYAAALPVLPAAPPTDRVLYQYALAVQRAGRFAEARPLFDRVCAQYPASAYARSARRVLDCSTDCFTVQCGVFSRLDAAQSLATELRGASFAPVVSRENAADGPRYYVRAGQYRTYADARRALDRLRTIQRDAFIVP